MNKKKTIVVIGGGAAGFFGAIAIAEKNPECRIIILEKNRQLLSKVKISGGGRCNVTHSCFEPALLTQNYPRGSKELLGPFFRFQPRDTINWFNARGVELKTESDGRMFPVTDSSETIISCFMSQVKKLGIEIWQETGVQDIEVLNAEIQVDHTQEGVNRRFALTLTNSETLHCDKILVATGSAPKIADILVKLGHTMVPPVPSLFTFNIPNSPLHHLPGISVPKVKLSLEECGLEQTGPLLITHWGFSGPAVLKLSAWGARLLHDRKYQCFLRVNWLPDITRDQILDEFAKNRQVKAVRQISSDVLFDLPKNLWKTLVELANIQGDLKWSKLPKLQAQNLAALLSHGLFSIDGKTTYKEEFVTSGGVKLREVDFKTMESRICPHLYFAGEVLDIDGVTGGFNFQNAWTTSWIAGQSM